MCLVYTRTDANAQDSRAAPKGLPASKDVNVDALAKGKHRAEFKGRTQPVRPRSCYG